MQRLRANYMGTRKREHLRKPDEQCQLIEALQPRPFSRNVWAWRSAQLVCVGQPGGRTVSADVENPRP